MDVRRVVEFELVDQPVADIFHRGQVVETEVIGRPHRGDDRRDLAAALQDIACHRLQQTCLHLVLGRARDLDHVVLPDAEPVRDGQAGIVSLLGTKDHCPLAHAAATAAGRRLFQTELHAVQHGRGPAKREQSRRLLRIVADERGGHRRHLNLGHRHLSGRLFTDQVRIVDRRKQPPDHAGDRGRRHDVDLRPRMSPDEQPRQMLHQDLCHLLQRLRSLLDPRSSGGVIIERHRFPQQRRHRFHRIELVERPQKRKHEIGIMHPIGNRLRKRLPQRRDKFKIRRSHRSIPEGHTRCARIRSPARPV